MNIPQDIALVSSLLALLNNFWSLLERLFKKSEVVLITT
jgi:hypothetical protein